MEKKEGKYKPNKEKDHLLVCWKKLIGVFSLKSQSLCSFLTSHPSEMQMHLAAEKDTSPEHCFWRYFSRHWNVPGSTQFWEYPPTPQSLTLFPGWKSARQPWPASVPHLFYGNHGGSGGLNCQGRAQITMKGVLRPDRLKTFLISHFRNSTAMPSTLCPNLGNKSRWKMLLMWFCDGAAPAGPEVKACSASLQRLAQAFWETLPGTDLLSAAVLLLLATLRGKSQDDQCHINTACPTWWQVHCSQDRHWNNPILPTFS